MSQQIEIRSLSAGARLVAILQPAILAAAITAI
jgi:hypothetical protein